MKLQSKAMFKLALLSLASVLFAQIGWSQEYLLVCNQENFFRSENKDLEKKIAEAESLIASDKQKEAISIYESLVKTNPDHLRSWQRLAQLYSWNNMADKAIGAYEQIVRLNPMDTAAEKNLAQFYLWNNRQKDAIDLYEKIVMLEPKNIEIHKKLAQLYSWNDMPEKAIAQYEQIVRTDTTDAATMKMLADHYFWTNRAEDGIRMLEKVIALEPDSVQYRKKLAQHLVWNNQPEKAIEQYEKILEKNPDDLEILKKLAQQYMWNNKPGEAAPLYERLAALETDSLNHKIQLAHAYLWSNQSAKAEKPLREILQKQPLNKEALLSLAEIERWSGRWDAAKSKLKKLKLFDPQNERAAKLLRDIRQHYGNSAAIKYARLSDSNLITRESIPLGAACFQNRYWDFRFQTAQYRVTDDRLDSTLIGHGAQSTVNFHPQPSTTVSLKIGAVNYSSNWTPLSAVLQLTQTIRGRFTAQLRYERHENQEGVRALTDHIILNGFVAEGYWQILSRWAISGNYQLFNYSDDNKKVTATAATYLTLKMKNPNLAAYGYYVFEDFEKIFPTSLPYWTPNELSTSSLGLNVKQPLFGFLDVEAGYGLTRQQSINSNNFSGKLSFLFTDFDKFYIGYLKTGSKVYHSTNFIVSFEHKF
ncbi:MAG: tetratricopeptide repeat protein [Calditrichaeota bacterium]|nr:tetratricopeptide repeat protein [Calditrichota bacterium]